MTAVKVAKDDDKPSDEKSLGAIAKNPPGTPNPDTDHSTPATDLKTIPGLTKNQQKKAAKKAQKKTNKVEKEDVEEENPTVKSKTKTRKDFMKTDTFDDMDEDVDDIENSFVFEERTEKSGHSKFFTKSPASAEDSVDLSLSPFTRLFLVHKCKTDSERGAVETNRPAECKQKKSQSRSRSNKKS